ncbi:alkylation response protein AidB-like acyl-CoA dehydrogenase [Rhizobium aquaticum]|uniref:Alkylation response protein AidB-like acyl-CoA dehydrogenase n=1 Tax=Rhizobium aquaticum TaxID=1549636 RepID=A0ABV2J678_9HYPH
MDRPIFDSYHAEFRDQIRRFIAAELAPKESVWAETDGVDRESWRAAGNAGILCCDIAEEYGGPGGDFLFNVVVIEEMARAGLLGAGGSFTVHSDMMATYIDSFGSEDQKQCWLPKMVAGEIVGSLALTEPAAGSDLKSIATRAVREGDEYVISGQKIYITNGGIADLMVVACKTDPSAGGRGISLILVEGDRRGLGRGRPLKKIGIPSQNTCELFFDSVRVPVANLLGRENGGFGMLITKLARERLTQTIRGIAVAERAIEMTVEHTSQRRAFQGVLGDLQNTRFKLAELSALVAAGRALADKQIALYSAGELDAVEAAKGKLFATDLQWRAVDECMQLFGGAGYMQETPIARLFVDSRVSKIAGGASEVMKHIIGDALFRDRH